MKYSGNSIGITLNHHERNIVFSLFHTLYLNKFQIDWRFKNITETEFTRILFYYLEVRKAFISMT